MTSQEPIVFVADDEPGVLKSLTRVLLAAGLRTAGYDSPRRFLEEHDPERPGCLVLDLVMPGLDGMGLQRSLEEKGVARPIVFLTGCGDVPTSVEAMKRGAVDFLTKPVDGAVLIDAVRRAIERDRCARQEAATAAGIAARLAALTPREREVMGHIVAGRLNKQVAASLGTTEKTIKVHRARVMEKMKAESLADLVRLAERAGIRGP